MHGFIGESDKGAYGVGTDYSPSLSHSVDAMNMVGAQTLAQKDSAETNMLQIKSCRVQMGLVP